MNFSHFGIFHSEFFFFFSNLFQMIIGIRDDLGTGASIFSRKHPLSCWASSMLMCFADSIFAHFLLGEPLITPFKRHEEVLVVSY